MSELGQHLITITLRLVRRHRLVGERGVGLLRALVLPNERANHVVAAALNISEGDLEKALTLLDEALTRAG